MREYSTSGRPREGEEGSWDFAAGQAGGLREREREPSSAFPPVFIVLLLIGTFRLRPPLARTVLCEALTQSVSQSIFSLAFSASNFTSRYGVSEGALPSPRLALLPCSLGGVSSFFSSPKNLLKTFSLQAGGGPPLSVRPLLFAFFHVAPSRFCSFSAVVVQRRFTYHGLMDENAIPPKMLTFAEGKWSASMDRGSRTKRRRRLGRFPPPPADCIEERDSRDSRHKQMKSRNFRNIVHVRAPPPSRPLARKRSIGRNK